MTTLKISARAFARLSWCATNEEWDKPDTRSYLYGVNVQRFADMRTYAVACNGKIAAVEYLDYTIDGAPGGATIKVRPDITTACTIISPDGTLVIAGDTVFMEVNGVPTDFFADALIPEPYASWRNFIPKDAEVEIAKSKGKNGVMAYRADHLYRLAMASPDGIIKFPDKIIEDGPVIVNSIHAENWFGEFLLTRDLDGEGKNILPKPATIPKWIR